MTREEATRSACSILGLAYHSIGDYSKASDGFCSKCPGSRETWHYQNDGHVLEYVRIAVVQRLLRDGYKIDKGFDPVTGKEIA